MDDRCRVKPEEAAHGVFVLRAIAVQLSAVNQADDLVFRRAVRPFVACAYVKQRVAARIERAGTFIGPLAVDAVARAASVRKVKEINVAVFGGVNDLNKAVLALFFIIQVHDAAR